MDFTLDYASLAKKLECQELESPSGQASPEVYGQLLAIYLLFDDLKGAKSLWKRIPSQIKTTNRELSVIWSVGQLMWTKCYSEIYQAIKLLPNWPNHLKNIMNLLLESTRQRALTLISKSYSVIQISDACERLGLTKEETIKLAETQNWSYDEESGYLVINRRPDGDTAGNGQKMNLDKGTELLEKLTDYIVFLERSNRH